MLNRIFPDELNSGEGEINKDGHAPEPRRIDKSFLLLATAVFVLLALITHPQILRGKVPLPSDVITVFPPWYAARGEPKTPHAEVSDSVTLFYPWRVFQEFAFHRRIMPLWNPYILGGTPFLANAQSALFYPIHLLLLIQHPPTLWTVKLLLNVILSGLFTAMFVRSIGGSTAGAIASGIVFSCCGFMVAWQAFSSLADGAIWLPFILWTTYRLCLRPSAGRMAITSLGLAMPILAGHPETAAHLILMGSGFALWQCVANGRKDQTVMRRLSWFVGAGMLAIGITAVQTLPTLEWLGQIEHNLNVHWPVRPVREILAFLSRDIVSDPNSADLSIPESAAYVASLALLMAPLAFVSRNSRRHTFYFLTVIVVSLAVVQGWWPVQWIVMRTPILSGMKNWRVLILIDFSLAVLAGLATTALGATIPNKIAVQRYIWAALGTALVALNAGIVQLSLSTHKPTEWLRSPASTALFLLLGFLLISARLLDRISSRSFGLIVIGLLAVDLASFRYAVLPFASRTEIFPQVPLFEFLQAHADPQRFRVSSIGATYPFNAEMIYGLATADGYDLALARTKNLLRDLGEPATGVAFDALRLTRLQDRRIDLMNLRYLVVTTLNTSDSFLNARPDRFKPVFSDGPVRVYENLRVLQRATFLAASPGAIELIPDEHNQLARLKNRAFDPERSVILTTMPAELEYATDSGSNPVASPAVSVVSHGINESTYRVVNQRSGILIISQIFYPGWLALVDGKETPVLRADYTFLGVPLSSGTHEVKLVFRPGSFRLGAGISLASCLVMAGLVIFSRKQ